ncbi:MAG: hypothetical protein QUS14_05435, partial [Pyrinomonadaceae bacterium]|nr:hypothetical protein [Pyrinomonadaceae bacterium]
SFVTVAIFGSAVKKAADRFFAARIILFVSPFWMIFQVVLAVGGFYEKFDSVPPRLIIFGPLAALLFILAVFVLSSGDFFRSLSIRNLTLVHVIRIPVEVVLHWLYTGGAVPREMTLTGYNFDIISGITAIFVYFIAFRQDHVNSRFLIAWNCVGLLLLGVIVTLAIISFPSPMQQIAFEQPNRAVVYFPYIWLPTVIVPIVLFCHLASLYKLLTNRLS